MFKIAICDNDANICNMIESELITQSKRDALPVHIDVFYSGEGLLDYLLQGNNYDIYYLDIEMNKISGIDVSKQIRKDLGDIASEIVYVSATTKYDRALFDFQPLCFLSKPLDAKAVYDSLKLAVKRHNLLKPTFQFSVNQKNYSVPFNRILYFESNGRKVDLITNDSVYTFYTKIAELNQKLPVYFCQIHRSYIVNINAVEKFSAGEVTMSNGVQINIGAKFRSCFNTLQIRNLNGEI